MSRKFESPFLDPIVDRNTTDICEIKQLRNQPKSTQIYHSHLNINSIRNKFESLVRFVGNSLDIYFSIRDKIDDTFPDSLILNEFFETV